MDEENGISPYQAPEGQEAPPSKPPKPTFTKGTWPATKWVVALVAVGAGITDGATSAQGAIPAQVFGYAIAMWAFTVFPGIIVYYCVPRQPIAYNVVMLVLSGLIGLGLIVSKLVMASAGSI